MFAESLQPVLTLHKPMVLESRAYMVVRPGFKNLQARCRYLKDFGTTFQPLKAKNMLPE